MIALDRLLADLRQHQVEVERRGDRLHLRAPAPPPPELMDAVRRHKPELLRMFPDPAARAVLHFRLVDYSSGSWATALGRPGETVEVLHAGLVDRYGARLVEVRAP